MLVPAAIHAHSAEHVMIADAESNKKLRQTPLVHKGTGPSGNSSRLE
jgi:hypothetical protein